MKAQKSRKTRLVKAESSAADHNRWQAERMIPNETTPERPKRKAKRFNPVPLSNEDQLKQLQARLVTLDGQSRCANCPPKVLEEIKAEAKACFKAIKGLERKMAETSNFAKHDIQSTRSSEVHRDRKAKAKVPKTAGHGLRGKPEPYTGPGKPTNKIKIEGKPTIFRVVPQGPPDRLKFNRPQRPESVRNGFRAWNSGAPRRKGNDDE